MNKIILFLIFIYKNFISPFLAPRCRFYPSCSTYCKQCYEVFSFPKASWYSLRRLLKCHPFNKGGFDPIPPLE